MGLVGAERPITARFIAGSSVKCASFWYHHATRVRIPAYDINLPVVKGPNGYPYCNVAMYMRSLYQPTEPGVTFIYAHARTGMFLPLLNASKKNNGAAMIGKLVYVYTSKSMRYTYKITKVRRHVSDIGSSLKITDERLWLQTSEGPNHTLPEADHRGAARRVDRRVLRRGPSLAHTRSAADPPVRRPSAPDRDRARDRPRGIAPARAPRFRRPDAPSPSAAASARG